MTHGFGSDDGRSGAAGGQQQSSGTGGVTTARVGWGGSEGVSR